MDKDLEVVLLNVQSGKLLVVVILAFKEKLVYILMGISTLGAEESFQQTFKKDN